MAFLYSKVSVKGEITRKLCKIVPNILRLTWHIICFVRTTELPKHHQSAKHCRNIATISTMAVLPEIFYVFVFRCTLKKKYRAGHLSSGWHEKTKLFCKCSRSGSLGQLCSHSAANGFEVMAELIASMHCNCPKESDNKANTNKYTKSRASYLTRYTHKIYGTKSCNVVKTSPGGAKKDHCNIKNSQNVRGLNTAQEGLAKKNI